MTYEISARVRSTPITVALFVLAVLSVTTIAVSASATEATCVAIDRNADMLSAADQNGAVTLFRQELNKLDVATAIEGGCDTTVVLTHIMLGDSITVMVAGRGRHLDTRVRSLDDLPGAYSQLAGALVGGTEVSEATNRQNVTVSQADPNRVKADSVVYFGLGYGMIAADQTQGGPGFAFGYRYELDWIAVDLSMDTSLFGLNEDRSSNPSMQEGATFGLNLDALYFFDPTSDRSLFVGGGLAWTGAYLDSSDTSWEGSGLAGRAVVGYELLRSSNIRLIAQAQAVLPFYTLSSSDYGYDLETGMPAESGDEGSRWAPTFTTSIGIGWN